jgi:hypothetical protein
MVSCEYGVIPFHLLSSKDEALRFIEEITCPNSTPSDNLPEEAKAKLLEIHGGGEPGGTLLLPVSTGLLCPYCGYGKSQVPFFRAESEWLEWAIAASQQIILAIKDCR